MSQNNVLDEQMNVVAWLAGTLDSIKDKLSNIEVQMATIGQEIKRLNDEQNRLDQRVKENEDAIRVLETDKIRSSARWNGPKIIAATLATVAPLAGGIYYLVQIFSTY